ncbi:hypothetical protein L2E82_39055 [Cichorium intybus]|uniref:Uncharacterized protein n=1 Tax=Cichorium intybus TaxID=13427 RepID=A0ACB9AH54_CICIN|nr:hypothetical protein L2E82_39055 [Cichorium intybus]
MRLLSMATFAFAQILTTKGIENANLMSRRSNIEEDVSIGTEIPNLDSCDQIRHEEHSSDSNNMQSDIENYFEEERAPDTPSLIHCLNSFHKNWLISDMKESLIEESKHNEQTSEHRREAEIGFESQEEGLKRFILGIGRRTKRQRHFRYPDHGKDKPDSRREGHNANGGESEYDQEALQLLNEFMMKKEKELELYRK